MDYLWHERLKKARKSKGISLEELSNKVEVSKQSLIKYEKGLIFPSIDVFCAICEECCVSPSYVLDGGGSDYICKRSYHDEILTLSLMFYSKRIDYSCNVSMIRINDEQLNNDLHYAVLLLNKLNINKIDDFIKFANAIKKM